MDSLRSAYDREHTGRGPGTALRGRRRARALLPRAAGEQVGGDGDRQFLAERGTRTNRGVAVVMSYRQCGLIGREIRGGVPRTYGFEVTLEPPLGPHHTA